MSIKIIKTDWMKQADLARLLNTSNQHVRWLKNKGKIKSKVDKYGHVLVKGITHMTQKPML
jgi:DNA-binding transcriptional regulator YiaG